MKSRPCVSASAHSAGSATRDTEISLERKKSQSVNRDGNTLRGVIWMSGRKDIPCFGDVLANVEGFGEDFESGLFGVGDVFGLGAEGR